jgi:hypothetical protein
VQQTDESCQRPPENAENSASPADDEVATLRRQVKELAGQLDRKNQHERRILEAEQFLADCDAEVADAAQTLKEKKEQREAAVAGLRREIKSRDGQAELPFKDSAGHVQDESDAAPLDDKESSVQKSQSTPAAMEDPAGKTPLTQIGVTPSQAEKLMGLDPAVETVADLETLIAAGGFVPGRIKGFGETILNKISDKLLEFRREHSNPNETQVAAVDGRWDPAQYHAGQIARADGKPATDHPGGAESTHARESWLAGWRAKDAEIVSGVLTGTDETGAKLMVIPLRHPDCEARIATFSRADGRFEATVRAAVRGGVSMAEERDETNTATWESVRVALIEGCERLAEWYRERIPKIGESVAVEIEEFSDTLWNSGSPEATALDYATELIEEIREAAESLPMAGLEFASGVLETTDGIEQWIDEHSHVTEDQTTALENMLDGLNKWQQA